MEGVNPLRRQQSPGRLVVDELALRPRRAFRGFVLLLLRNHLFLFARVASLRTVQIPRLM